MMPSAVRKLRRALLGAQSAEPRHRTEIVDDGDAREPGELGTPCGGADMGLPDFHFACAAEAGDGDRGKRPLAVGVDAESLETRSRGVEKQDRSSRLCSAEALPRRTCRTWRSGSVRRRAGAGALLLPASRYETARSDRRRPTTKSLAAVFLAPREEIRGACRRDTPYTRSAGRPIDA